MDICAHLHHALHFALRAHLLQSDKVWPTSTYAMLALTIPVAVLSVRLPRLFLCLGIISRVVAYLLLLFGEGLPPMVTVEILYAAFLVIDSNVLITCACLYATEEEYAKATVGEEQRVAKRRAALVLPHATSCCKVQKRSNTIDIASHATRYARRRCGRQ